MSPVKDYEYAPVPHLTTEQRREYQKRAVDMRKRRAALKLLIANGAITAQEALDAEPARKMRVYEFLLAFRGVGPSRAYKIMERVKVSPNRRVMGLGCRQRAAIVKELS